jgi:hypothetical protein
MQVIFMIFAFLPAMLFATVPVWFVLILTLFKRLETNHPEKYTAMGRPSLFQLSNTSNGWPTLRFLVAREHKAMAAVLVGGVALTLFVPCDADKKVKQ